MGGVLTPKGAAGLAMAGAAIALSVAAFLFRRELEHLGRFGYLGAFLMPAVGCSLVSVPFPWILILAPMGQAYSHVWLTVLAALGAASGELVAYALGARLGGANWLTRLLPRLSKPRQTALVVGLAFSPLFSYPGLIAGALRYPLWAMVAIVFVAEGTKVWLLIQATTVGLGFFGS